MDIPSQFAVPKEIQCVLAKRMRSARLRLGWKQETLASRSGVSLPTVRRYESTGQTSMNNFLKLCFALGLLEEVNLLFQTPEVNSIAELEAIAKLKTKIRQRGNK
jgi:transcriptional regulator with XRE-family HTH domain